MITNRTIDAIISLTIIFLSVFAFASMADARGVPSLKSFVGGSALSQISAQADANAPAARTCR